MRKLSVEPDSVLAAIKERLLDAFGDNVQRVVLFGSRSRGDAQQDSDYDVLLLVRSRAQVSEDRLDDVSYELLDRYGAVVMIFVEEEAVFERPSAEPLFDNIQREGAVL